MVDQTVGIMPRKLFINKSNDLYLTKLRSSSESSMTYCRQWCTYVTDKGGAENTEFVANNGNPASSVADH